MGDNNRVYIGLVSSGNSSSILVMICVKFRVQFPVIIRDFMILQIINFSVPSARQKLTFQRNVLFRHVSPTIAPVYLQNMSFCSDHVSWISSVRTNS